MWKKLISLVTVLHLAPTLAIATPRWKDRDNDTVVRRNDACLTQVEDFDGFEDQDGCPDLDNDQDRILDTDDRCPNELEDRDGYEDEDGCPDTDNDRDGLGDTSDRCPNQVEDLDGFEDENGCPELDNDGDGFLDLDDKCPKASSKTNGGCPLPETKPPVEAELYSGPSKKVTLPFIALMPVGIATLDYNVPGEAPARNVCNQVAQQMLLLTSAKIRIIGMTSKENRKKNGPLSEERAEIFAGCLQDQFITPDRFEVIGDPSFKYGAVAKWNRGVFIQWILEPGSDSDAYTVVQPPASKKIAQTP